MRAGLAKLLGEKRRARKNVRARAAANRRSTVVLVMAGAEPRARSSQCIRSSLCGARIKRADRPVRSGERVRSASGARIKPCFQQITAGLRLVMNVHE